jgi:hypothetical protein
MSIASNSSNVGAAVDQASHPAPDPLDGRAEYHFCHAAMLLSVAHPSLLLQGSFAHGSYFLYWSCTHPVLPGLFGVDSRWKYLREFLVAVLPFIALIITILPGVDKVYPPHSIVSGECLISWAWKKISPRRLVSC